MLTFIFELKYQYQHRFQIMCIGASLIIYKCTLKEKMNVLLVQNHHFERIVLNIQLFLSVYMQNIYS